MGLVVRNGETQRQFGQRCRKYLLDKGYLKGNQVVVPIKKGAVGMDETKHTGSSPAGDRHSQGVRETPSGDGLEFPF